MNRLVQQIFAMLVTCVALMGGCAAQRVDRIATGHVVVQPHIDRSMRTVPEVYEEEGDLVVTGRVECDSAKHPGAHVDVSVIGPDGALVYEAQLNYRAGVSSSPSTIGPRIGSFRRGHPRKDLYDVYAVRFPGMPPEGSVVKVRYDTEPHVYSNAHHP